MLEIFIWKVTWAGRVCWGAVLVQPDHNVTTQDTPAGICWIQRSARKPSCASAETQEHQIQRTSALLCDDVLFICWAFSCWAFQSFLGGKWSKICPSLSELVTGRNPFVEIRRKFLKCSLFSCVKWNLWKLLCMSRAGKLRSLRHTVVPAVYLQPPFSGGTSSPHASSDKKQVRFCKI